MTITTPTSLYETDYPAWLEQQARAIRDRQWNEIDLENLIEEIEVLGGEQLHKVESYLQQLIEHRFKLEYVGDEYCRASWEKEIRNFTRQLYDRLTKTLLNKIDLSKVYRRVLNDVLRQYPKLKGQLPDTCPWTLDELYSEIRKHGEG